MSSVLLLHPQRPRRVTKSVDRVLEKVDFNWLPGPPVHPRYDGQSIVISVSYLMHIGLCYLLAYRPISKTMSQFHGIFCTWYLWPWFSSDDSVHDMLHTSGFVDDVMLSHNGPVGRNHTSCWRHWKQSCCLRLHFVGQGSAQDVKPRDRDAHLPRPKRDRDLGFTSRDEK